MRNAEIALHFDELGDPYELDGAIVHRVVAYRTAAAAIRNSPTSVEQLVREGRATELPAFPGIERDISVVVADSVAWSQIEGIVESKRRPPLESVAFVGTFRGQQLEIIEHVAAGGDALVQLY